MMVCLFFFCYCVHFPFEENIFAGTEAGLVQNYKFPLTFLIFLVFPAPVQEHAKFSCQKLKILKNNYYNKIMIFLPAPTPFLDDEYIRG